MKHDHAKDGAFSATLRKLRSKSTIDITYPFFSQCFIMVRRFSSEVISKVRGTIFCQKMKKIHNDKLGPQRKYHVLTGILFIKRINSTFLPLLEKGCLIRNALISKRFELQERDWSQTINLWRWEYHQSFVLVPIQSVVITV